MNLFCWAIGHKRIHGLDGSITCARCRQKLKRGAIDQMREMDPDWYAEYSAPGKSAYEAIMAFDKRHPGVLKR